MIKTYNVKEVVVKYKACKVESNRIWVALCIPSSPTHRYLRSPQTPVLLHVLAAQEKPGYEERA